MKSVKQRLHYNDFNIIMSARKIPRPRSTAHTATESGTAKGPEGGGGVLLGILGGGVPPGTLNPNPISDQKMSFTRPVFRPDL